MSDDTLQVELVAADRLVWSGEAKVVNARTAGGEIGILANHMPVLSLLEAGVVEIETADGETWLAAVDDGFLSVAANRVSILAGHADLAQRHRRRRGRARARPQARRRGRRPPHAGRGPTSRGARPRRREGVLSDTSHLIDDRGPFRFPGRPSAVSAASPSL